MKTRNFIVDARVKMMKVLNGKYNHANVMIDQIDETTETQIKSFLDHPVFQKCHIAIMPDCHAGAGAVIGFTARIKDYVIPNIVGVDLGCGVLAIQLGKVDLDLADFDKYIKGHIPCGMKHRSMVSPNVFEDEYFDILDAIEKICFRLNLDYDDVLRQAGTLGGGNHFIEVDIDKDDNKWLLIHTGSRNFGLKVANYWQNKAKQLTSRMFVDVSKGLEFLPLEYGGAEYIEDMIIAQKFAKINRAVIKDILAQGHDVINIESVHNYIDKEMMIRKGAISAKEGEKLVIPLNMRDGVIIGRGKGNNLWNQSAPHGAGRIMSRSQAKKQLTIEAFKESMDGIYSTCLNADTLDEAPFAYKPSEVILNAIKDTVEVEAILKPIYNFKASE
jgi:RNA-splicing ligase RtcB